MKTRFCQNCDAPFDRHDLMPFVFMRPGNTINCLSCLDLNYLIPKKTMAYWFFFCFASAMGLVIFGSVYYLLGFMGIRLGNFGYGLAGIVRAIVAVIFLIFGIISGVFFARFVLKLWNWKNGNLTLDDNAQSILDFS